MNNGWVKIYRKIIDCGFYKRSSYVHLWLHLLLKASHQEQKFMWNGKIIIIKDGQILTGRKQLSEETGIPETTIERALDFFEKNGHQIGQQKTTKYRLITILNWNSYQKSDSKADNKRTTNGQQTDTYKNDKNILQSDALPQRSLTKIQEIVNYFFSLKEWATNGTGGEKVYSRYTKPAKELLGLCDDDVLEAKNCIKKVADWAISRDLDWSIETVFKKWYDLDSLQPKEKKPYFQGNRVFEIAGRKYVLMPNGEKLQFAGNENDIVLK